ncbi:Rib/alpha-like domain-containing protein, partial [Facklamia hominis]|uniref:Rib/alpha-like domain-containing protein n=1 Tax=Facklamia hominis TaxID=178214 RepID=UPI00288B9CE8
MKDGEAAKYEPEYKEVEGKVGEEATVAAPTFTDRDGKPATPENVTYELGEGAPAGAKVNADGSVTYTPVDADAGKTVEIPVVVKYSDGTTDKVKAPIKVAQKDADNLTPTYADKDGKAGEAVTTDAPTYKDADGKDATAPEGTKYTLGENAPEGATIDENTGEVTYTPKESEAGKPVEIPVVVTYPDKSTDNATAKINVAKLDDIIDRTGDEDKPTPAGYVRVTFKAGDGVNEIANNKVYDVKEGTALTADKYPEVTAKDGYENPVWSTPAGTAITKDNATITATATKTTPAEKDADKYEPEVAKEEVEKGGKVDLTDNVTNLDKLPEGTKVEDVTPEGAIDTNTPGDYTGKIKVTYPDGSSEEKDVPVTVKDTTPAEKDADKYEPTVEKEEVEKGGK